MAKKLYNPSVQFEIDHPGCMGGLINIFDFRRGHSAQKLISDRRRGREKHGVGFPRTRLHLLTDGGEKGGRTDAGSSNLSDKAIKFGTHRTSVKTLMDEEMSKLPEQLKKQIPTATDECFRPDSGRGGRLRKNHKVACDINSNDLGTSTRLKLHQSSHLNSMKRLPVIEEFSSQNHKVQEMQPKYNNKTDSHHVQKCSILTKYGPLRKTDAKLLQKHPLIKGRPIEETELLLNKKFINARQHIKDGAVHQSKELLDALEILNSNKELFLKLLQDPNSLLVKHIQDLRNAQLEKLSKAEETGNSVEQDETVSRKQFRKYFILGFFRRKDKKTKGKNLPNSIVILKPNNPPMIENSMTSTSSSSLDQSHYTLRNQAKGERITSHYSYREITRRFKHVMGERKGEKNWISKENNLHQVPNGYQDSRDISHTSLGNENTTDLSVVPNTGNEKGKSDTCESTIVHDAALSSFEDHKDLNELTDACSNEGRVGNYKEAKKHPTETLDSGYGSEDLSMGRVLETFQRTLSDPESNMLPLRSCPAREKELATVSEPKRYFTYENYRYCGENVWFFKKEKFGKRSSPPAQNVESSCTDGSSPEKQLQEPLVNSELSKENIPDSETQESTCNRGESSSKGNAGIIKIAGDACLEESTLLHVSSKLESNNTLSIESNHSNYVTEKCKQEGFSEFFRQDSSEEETTPASSLVSFSRSLLLIDAVSQEGISEKPEHTSPVSLLEPFFIEEVIPASTQNVELPMRQPEDHFKEQDNLATEITPLDFKINQKDCVKQKASKFEYVRTVLQASGLCFGEFKGWSNFQNWTLSPLLFNEVEGFSAQSLHEQRLYFDCINEVLADIYEKFFSILPWLSFAMPNTQHVLMGIDVAGEVWKGVVQLLRQQTARTVDEITGNDMSKAGTWMDLRFDAESVGIDMGEILLEDLMEEMILELQD